MDHAKDAAYLDLASAAETPVSAPPVRELADQRKVFADQVDLLFRHSPLGILITIVVGGIATYELWGERNNELVTLWCLMMLFVGAARHLLYRAYYRRRGGDHEQWLRWFAIGAFGAGAVWGFAGTVFFPAHTDAQQVFLAFLIAGIVAGGIPVFSAVWWVYALYGIAIIAPFTYILATYGSRLFLELAVLVPFFLAVNISIAMRLSRVFADGFRLRHAYAHLGQDHSMLNAQLQEQIEELVQAQREVEASGRKLALFAERAPIAVFEVDPNGTILEMNPSAENTFGYSSTELIGRSMIRMLIPSDEPLLNSDWWKKFVADARPEAGLRVRCRRRDAVELICEISLTPLVNDVGELISVITQCHDITRQLEGERLKKEFTSTLSHELRTPLTSIIGSLQLINTGMLGDLDKEISELTTIAERNGQRLLDLINDLLDIDKIESGKLTTYPEPIPLDELVRESLVLNRAFADRFGVRMALRGEPAPLAVFADKKRLIQVMTNLMSNASKFSPEGGIVEVALERVDNMARVSVEDRGSGIPPEFRNRIFGRFAQADSAATRQKGGTGLGLAICKRLIELMGGRIGFTDREGGGTVFFFELPLLDQPVAQSE
jgi:PAS domain S-box-containing protein